MIALYPGSFDPVTKGHLDIIRRALVFCPKLVIGVGSNIAKQYLFDLKEREAMLRDALSASFGADDLARLDVVGFTGATVHLAEKVRATLVVKGIRTPADYAAEEKMVIVNRRLTTRVDTVFLMTENDLRDVSSSAVRELAKIGVAADKLDHYVTASVRDAVLAKYRKA